MLDLLPTIVSLARTGSISATARALGVPRSTVSRRLARAEEELGVVLAERNNRAFRLTPAGRHLAREGEALLARLHTV
ncbi:MAG: LysR family transcriptional regulator, partial [Myxococcales bacterium]|nr:LysR family transcriptional regulator [Myxococcales bacterium]